MDPTDLAFWEFDSNAALVPSHQKWTSTVTFERRYKLRGFPDLTTSPVVATGRLDLRAGGATGRVRLD